MIQESPRRLNGTEIKREHRPRPLLLPSRDFVLRVRRQSRVKNLPNFGVRVQMPRHGNSIRIVLQHAHRQRFDSARNEKTVHRRQAGSCRALDEIDFLRIFRPSENHRPARRIAMSIQILGHRMHHDVRAEFNRPLQVRAQKRVIYRESDASFVGQLGHGRDVRHAHRGIRRRFDIKQFRIGPHGHPHRFRRRRVHEAEFQPEVH